VNTVITDKDAREGWRGWMFYDAECSLCVALAARFAGMLRRQRIDLVPLQAAGVPERLAIRPPDLLKEMRFLTQAGEVFAGAEAVAQVARQFWWGWPLFAWSRAPGAMAVLRRLYRWIAQRRSCAGGACQRRRPLQLQAWLPLALLPLLALNFKPVLPAWGFMWAMAAAIFLGAKWLTWREASATAGGIRLSRSLAYLLAWPGMDAERFLAQCPGSIDHARKPVAANWCFAIAKTFFGIWLVWGVVRFVDGKHPLFAGWTGLVGLCFLLHFGFFHLLALMWRQLGINAQPIMRAPILATSLAEFWGKRWNAAFHQLAHTYVFQPLRGIIGSNGATLWVFFLSGLIHEAVISLPANGGYGLPTAYFLLQGFGLLFQRSKPGRWLELGGGLRGWLFTLVCAAAPAFWLFHPPFINNVILPFLHEIGAT